MTQAEAPAKRIIIHARMEQIIRLMLDNPRRAYCVNDVRKALGLNSGTVTPLMHAMHEAGWLAMEVEPRRPFATGPLRKMYKFTPGTAPMLRKAIR